METIESNNEDLTLGRRLLLREGGEEEVETFASHLSFPRRMDVPEDEERDIPRTVIWNKETGPVLVYREDLITGLPYVMAGGRTHEEMTGFSELIETTLDTLRLHELIERVDTTTDPESIPTRIADLGLGAPNAYDEAVHSRICQALRSPDNDVREAGLIAITFQPWAEYLQPVSDLLRRGIPQDLTDIAEMILADLGANPHKD